MYTHVSKCKNDKTKERKKFKMIFELKKPQCGDGYLTMSLSKIHRTIYQIERILLCFDLGNQPGCWGNPRRNAHYHKSSHIKHKLHIT
jgi:hypothetical protein